MLITDTVDGRLMVRLLRQASGRDNTLAYRRRIGWGVVILSYSMAVYEVATYIHPGVEASAIAMTAIGSLLFIGLLTAFVCQTARTRANARRNDR
jgi:high-affinity nickel-transport protein